MNDSEGELLDIFSSLSFQKRVECLFECFFSSSSVLQNDEFEEFVSNSYEMRNT